MRDNIRSVRGILQSIPCRIQSRHVMYLVHNASPSHPTHDLIQPLHGPPPQPLAPEPHDRLPLLLRARHAVSRHADLDEMGVPLLEGRERACGERGRGGGRAVEDEERGCAERRERRVREQGPADRHDRPERPQDVCPIPILIRPLLLELGPPPLEARLGRDAPALREAEEMHALRRPGALVDEVVYRFAEELDCGGGVWVREELAEGVEGCVPLVCFFVEEGDSRRSGSENSGDSLENVMSVQARSA